MRDTKFGSRKFPTFQVTKNLVSPLIQDLSSNKNLMKMLLNRIFLILIQMKKVIQINNTFFSQKLITQIRTEVILQYFFTNHWLYYIRCCQKILQYLEKKTFFMTANSEISLDIRCSIQNSFFFFKGMLGINFKKSIMYLQ